MTTKSMYQMHIRSWETMEYLPPIYIVADSVDDAFDQMEPFRPLYQCKSAHPEGSWIDMDGTNSEDDRFDHSFSDYDDGDLGWSDELHENMEFEAADEWFGG